MKKQRIHTLDIIRGFALIGIFIVNIRLMVSHNFLKVSFGEVPRYEGSSRIIDGLTTVFVEGAFISLFTLLFGIGFGLFMKSAEQKDCDAVHLFRRRMTGLLVIGLIHLFFIWLGDILTLYAISGFVLLFFYRMKVKTLVVTGTLFLTAFLLLLMSRLTMPAAWLAEMRENGSAEISSATALYETAPSAEWLTFRLFDESPDMFIGNLFLLPFTIGMFLIGFALSKAGVFQAVSKHRRLFTRILAISLLFSIPLIASLSLVYTGALTVPEGQGFLLDSLSRATGISLAFVYLSGLTLLIHHQKVPTVIGSGLSLLGRMALTHYVTQSIFTLTVIYAFGLYGQVSHAEGLGLVAVIVVIQIAFSHYWLSRHRQGPLEKIWRNHTYRHTKRKHAQSVKNKKENHALLTGAFANLVMAGLAWYTYYLSNSEAILLDGNYSFIMFLGVLVALYIAKIKAQKTVTFPLGQFFFEALYSLIKGLLILGVLIMAVATAIIRIIMYTSGEQEQIPMLIPEPILFYALLCTVICYSVSFFYYTQNRSLGHASILLKTEQKATFVDGTLSLGIAGGIFALTMGGTGGEGSFVPYLADSIFVLILASILIREPVGIIKESIIELAGGTLQNQEKRELFEETVRSSLSGRLTIEDIFISKSGSKYMILVYISAEGDAYVKTDIRNGKRAILNKLAGQHPYLSVDLIPEGEPLLPEE